MTALRLLAGAAAAALADGSTLGPGSGPWTVASPESVGLSAQALREAEEVVGWFAERQGSAPDPRPSTACRERSVARRQTHPCPAA